MAIGELQFYFVRKVGELISNVCIGYGRLRAFRYAKSSVNAGDWAIAAMPAIGIRLSVRIMFGLMTSYRSELNEVVGCGCLILSTNLLVNV